MSIIEKFTYDENIFSDLYKEVYGSRPRDHEFYSASAERKQEIWDWLCEAHDYAMEEDRKREAAALVDFEDQVAVHMDHGAPTREDAILWMYDQWCDETGMMGLDFFFYHCDLPWSFATELEAQLTKFMAK